MAKILHLMLSKGKGGIQQAALNYAALLDRTSHTCLHVFHEDTVLLSCSAELSAAPALAGVIHSLSPISMLDPLALYKLHKITQQFKPELIISHGRRAGFMAKLIAPHTRHVHVLHRYRFQGLHAYTQVWCVSPDIQSSVPSDIPSRTIPLWLPALPKPVPIKTEGLPTIGFMGRFVPEKGADILLNALRLLPASALNVQCLLAGDGPEKADLQKYIHANNLQNHVTFCGWVEDKAAFFSKIDVLCVPSRHESFGLVVLEAWAHGVPVVTTSTAHGPVSLINKHETGIICDPNALDESLRHVLFSSELRAHIRANALQDVQNYTADATLPLLEQAVESALQVNA